MTRTTQTKRHKLNRTHRRKRGEERRQLCKDEDNILRHLTEDNVKLNNDNVRLNKECNELSCKNLEMQMELERLQGLLLDLTNILKKL